MTMENLGLAQEALAEFGPGGDAEGALAEAAGCLEAALRVSIRQHMPYNHAKASEALARVREKLAALGGDSA